MLLEILGLAALTNLFVWSEPTNILKAKVYKLIKKEEEGFIYRLLSCCLCSGFYIGFIFTLSLYQAAIIAVLAELISKKLTEGKL